MQSKKVPYAFIPPHHRPQNTSERFTSLTLEEPASSSDVLPPAVHLSSLTPPGPSSVVPLQHVIILWLAKSSWAYCTGAPNLGFRTSPWALLPYPLMRVKLQLLAPEGLHLKLSHAEMCLEKWKQILIKHLLYARQSPKPWHWSSNQQSQSPWSQEHYLSVRNAGRRQASSKEWLYLIILNYASEVERQLSAL